MSLNVGAYALDFDQSLPVPLVPLLKRGAADESLVDPVVEG